MTSLMQILMPVLFFIVMGCFTMRFLVRNKLLQYVKQKYPDRHAELSAKSPLSSSKNRITVLEYYIKHEPEKLPHDEFLDNGYNRMITLERAGISILITMLILAIFFGKTTITFKGPFG